MTKKIFFLIVTLCAFCYSNAENVTGFQIQASYLENGKLKVNSTGSTPFKIDVGFTRYNGSSGFESADFDFKLVAFNSSTGQVVDLTLLLKVGTSDFGTSNYVQKTYDVGVNYSNLNIPINSLKIALLWKSSRAPAPVGSPLGFNYFNTDYQVVVVTAPPSTPIPFYRNTVDGKVYVKLDGAYRHIYDLDALNACFLPTVVNDAVTGSTDPTPLEAEIGRPKVKWEFSGPPTIINQTPLLVNDQADGKVYFVEKKGDGFNYTYTARWIINPEAFSYYKFNSASVVAMTVNWTSDPFAFGDKWFKGTDLIKP
ncbi:hypothetical protein ACLOAU_11940 [Niabella sp. CJ426]|uniref:hypothetical protein n=1 Tax=Niabella sp. CJ426 TaxID=3393740 RepID=UPI003D005A21